MKNAFDMIANLFLVPPGRVFAATGADGLTSSEDKERAWRDTEGYPYYVELWKEEGCRAEIPAVMLKNFHDRTTRWFRPHEKRWLQFTLLLDQVNFETLKHVLEDHVDAAEVFRWFESEDSIRDTQTTVFRVREYLRSRLACYLQITDPALYRRLDEKRKALMSLGG